jgi:hypothetical protein
VAKAKNNQTPAQPQQEQPKQSQRKPKKYRSLSNYIEVFEHEGVRYIIHPNSVVENLPEDAPQVQKLIKEKKLVEVK